MLFAFIAIGIFSGFLGGLLGISGGIIAVPALYFIFQKLFPTTSHLMHLAIGTSLASMLFNSFASMWFHSKKQGVKWPVVNAMLGGIILGAALGALIASFLSSSNLKLIFGIIICIVGIVFFFLKKPTPKHHLLKPLMLNSLGFIIAFLSNILGIGGSIFTGPLLIFFGMEEKKAIGSAAATGFFITLLGALAYLLVGLHEKKGNDSIGFLYLPAFFAISIASVLIAPLGVKVAHALSGIALKRIFSLVLVAIGLLMIF